MATPAQISKKKSLEEKNPRRRVGLVVLKDKREFWIMSPTRNQWHGFKEAMADKMRKKVAMENLAAMNSLDPPPEKMQELFDLEPVLAETIADHVAKLGGHDEEAEMVDFRED